MSALYPIICHSKQRLEGVFTNWNLAQEFYAKKVKEKKDYFIANEITRGRLEQFKRSNLLTIFSILTDKELNIQGNKAQIAKGIIDYCNQPAHLPGKKILPLVDLDKDYPLDTNSIEDYEIRKIEKEKNYVPLFMVDDTGKVNSAIVDKDEIKKTFTRKEKRKRKYDRRKKTGLYLAATNESYSIRKGKPSARYLFHRYILEGLDQDIILQRVSNQLGEKQTIDTYYKYKFELQKIRAH